MLVATAIAFLDGSDHPDAFGEAGGWFAATYIAVRLVGLGLYGRVAWETWPSGVPCAGSPSCPWAASPPWLLAAW